MNPPPNKKQENATLEAMFRKIYTGAIHHMWYCGRTKSVRTTLEPWLQPLFAAIRGIDLETTASERWCELDVATIHSRLPDNSNANDVQLPIGGLDRCVRGQGASHWPKPV